MKQSMPEERRQLTDEEEQAIMNHISAFQGSANVQDQALALYVNAKVGTWLLWVGHVSQLQLLQMCFFCTSQQHTMNHTNRLCTTIMQ